MELAILVRHGESEFSARSLVNSDVAVSCPLTARGAEEARRLGESLADEPIDLCVTSEFERTRQTAELALAGRDVPCVVMSELNDPRAGRFEGGALADYRDWAWSHGSGEEPPGGGESRFSVVSRYVRGFRHILDRPEPVVVVVVHALPIAYVLGAIQGREVPEQRVSFAVPTATPFRVSAGELREAAERLETWCAAPSW